MFNINHSGIELLSVELWREIFDYFDVNDLWYSFRGLNKQIDGIIDQVQLHLNFEKKSNYDYFIKNILPSINVVNIQSLKLRKENKIKHFFSIYSLNSLVQLRLLSLDGIHSFNDNLFTFWNQLSSLKYLQSLKVIFGTNSHPNNDLKEKEFIIRSIFNQDFCPLLTCFIIKNKGNDNLNTELPIRSLIQTTKMININHLSIDNLTFNDLIKLLPALQNTKLFCINDELSCNNKFCTQQTMTVEIPLMFECKNWFHLLDAKKWELLLSVQCSKLLEFELVCNGDDDDNDYGKAGHDFEEECRATTFWIERNAIISYEFYSNDDFYYTIVKFNIGK
ncbi:unnamed protein product, partial [Rotaria sordida]